MFAERMDRARVAEVAAAVEARIGIGNLAPAAGPRYADAVAMARYGRHVADDQNGRAAGLAEPQESEDRIGVIVADDPAEAVAARIALMQRTFGGIEVVEIAD